MKKDTVIMQIMNLFEKHLDKIDKTKLLDNKIIYDNGRNGTIFDFTMNDHVSNFIMLYDDHYEAIKIGVYKDGTAMVYLYKVGEMKPFETHEEKFSKYFALCLAALLYCEKDCKGIFDDAIEPLKDVKVTEDMLYRFKSDCGDMDAPNYLYLNEYFLNNDITSTVEMDKQNFSTGEVVAIDPFVMTNPQSFVEKIPVGSYKEILSIYENRVAASKLVIADKNPVRYGMALCNGEDISTLTEGNFFCFPVDSGSACFIDKSDIEDFSKYVKEYDGGYIFEDKEYKTISYGDHKSLNVYSSGYGDGAYATFFGYDEDDNICCIVIQFITIESIDHRLAADNKLILKDSEFELDSDKSVFYITKKNNRVVSWGLDCKFLEGKFEDNVVSPSIQISDVAVDKENVNDLVGMIGSIDNPEESFKREDGLYLFEFEPFMKYKLECLEINEAFIKVKFSDTEVITDGYSKPYKTSDMELECVLPIKVSYEKSVEENKKTDVNKNKKNDSLKFVIGWGIILAIVTFAFVYIFVESGLSAVHFVFLPMLLFGYILEGGVIYELFKKNKK